ncbi:MAG: winged helix-turn-helix domain-containing protein [Pseudomonadota bacterium]
MLSTVNHNSWVVFGQTRYNPENAQLIGPDDQQIHLRAQSEQVFAILFSNLGVVVSRETLISAVWPDLNVTDDSLTQCISDIRKALGDRERSLLKTVPKRGFILQTPQAEAAHQVDALARKLAEVSDTVVTALPGVSASLEPADVTAMAAFGTPRSDASGSGAVSIILPRHRASLGKIAGLARARKLRIGVDLCRSEGLGARRMAEMAHPGQTLLSADARDMHGSDLDLIFADLGFLEGPHDSTPQRAFSAEPIETFPTPLTTAQNPDLKARIAIIPPHSLHNGDGAADIGDLIADTISSVLSRSTEIAVISRLSCAPFKNMDISLSVLRRLLGVDFVVSGSFYAQNDKVSFTLELADCTADKVLWTDRKIVGISDLLFEDDAIDDIVAHLRRAIVVSEVKRVKFNPVEKLSNYSVLIGAIGLMHRLSPREFESAHALLKALIDRVPNHPAPYAWLARWYVLKVVQGWSEDPKTHSSLAMDCAQHAIDLDPDNALAHVNQGIVQTNLLRRLDDAELSYQTALQINPNDAHGRLLQGMLFAFQDRGADAVIETERALALAPLDPFRFFFLALTAGAHLSAGNYAHALDLTKASLKLNRTHTSSQRMLVVASHLAGRHDEAREALGVLRQAQPDLTVSAWMKGSPSADFDNGRRFAAALREVGLPE